LANIDGVRWMGERELGGLIGSVIALIKCCDLLAEKARQQAKRQDFFEFCAVDVGKASWASAKVWVPFQSAKKNF
jgi:hypothetical protein